MLAWVWREGLIAESLLASGVQYKDWPGLGPGGLGMDGNGWERAGGVPRR